MDGTKIRVGGMVCSWTDSGRNNGLNERHVDRIRRILIGEIRLNKNVIVRRILSSPDSVKRYNTNILISNTFFQTVPILQEVGTDGVVNLYIEVSNQRHTH